MHEIKLPAFGLAEEVLAQFMDGAQMELDHTVPQEEKVENDMSCHLVTFHLAEEEYGIGIENVQEIIRASDITCVPGAPSHVKGVINLRGKIIPVVDLRRRFSLPEIAESEFQRIIVVELGEKRLGILVDSVSQVIRLSSSIIEKIPEEVTTVDENYIKGVGKLDSRLIIILDLNRSLLLT